MTVDDYSEKKVCDFLKRKSDLKIEYLDFLIKLRSKGKDVKYIKCDNVGENKELEKECYKKTSTINSNVWRQGHHSNSVVERKFATLIGRMRAAYIETGVTKNSQFIV